jgi:hypothetical protein
MIIDEDRGRGRHSRPLDPDYGNVRSMCRKLDLAAEEWGDPGMISAGQMDFVRLAPDRKGAAELQRYVAAAEEFIVCHEISHHVLAHTATSARKRARAASALIAPLIEDVAVPLVWDGLSEESRKEIEADLVGIAIASGHIDGCATRGSVYRALGGAVVALIAATHVNEHWVEYDPDGSHPPLILRLCFIFSATHSWFSEMSRGEAGDHPLDQVLQLRIFAELLMTHWAESQDTEIASRNAEISDREYADALALRFLHGWTLLRTKPEANVSFPSGGLSWK